MLATIPAVIVGFGFRKLLGDAFASPTLAAFFLVANGFALYFGDEIAGEGERRARATQLEGRAGDRRRQCFALIPGFSRSGLTIAAGDVAGLRHEASARFSFLMATPIMSARPSRSAQAVAIRRDARRRRGHFGRRRRRGRLSEPVVSDALFSPHEIRR